MIPARQNGAISPCQPPDATCMFLGLKTFSKALIQSKEH